MTKCNSCEYKYPEEILWMGQCGICGLARTNEILGINRTTFVGEMAEDFRLQAIEWRKKQ